MHRRVVINADDLGLIESVNRGIAETIEHGVVRSASLMVNMPGTDDAAAKIAALKAKGHDFGIGLHFNIVAGVPLTDCPALRDPEDRREFAGLLSLLVLAMIRKLPAAEIQRELDAQLDLAESILAPHGMRVTHVDSHRHAHCLPGIHDIVVEGARARRISHVRHPYEQALPRGNLRAWTASRALRYMLRRQIPMDDIGFTGFGAMAARDYPRAIEGIIATLAPGTTELMTHPGYDSPELGAIDPYRAPRERERAWLTSSRARELLRSLRIEGAHFGSRE